jgi:hypothetical protein
MTFAAAVALYAGGGLLFGCVAHDLFGSSPRRSWLVRSIPLGLAWLLAVAMEFRSAAGRTVAVTVYRYSYERELVDAGMLVALSLAVAILVTLEWRRARSGTLQTA